MNDQTIRIRDDSPYIRGLDNLKITFLDLKHEQIKVDHILLSLAKTCGYHGLLRGFYSNAEHSILCARQAESMRMARYCLIHDFGEAITADVAGPVKRQFPEYKKFCDEVQNFMYWHFMGTSADVPEMVKVIDKRMRATEQQQLRNAPAEDFEGYTPYTHVEFKLWEWRDAYVEITHYFRELFPGYKDAV